MARQAGATCNVCFDTFDPRAMVECDASEACSFVMCAECTVRCGLAPCRGTQCTKLHWQCPACRQGCAGVQMSDERLTSEMAKTVASRVNEETSEIVGECSEKLTLWSVAMTESLCMVHGMMVERDNETMPAMEEVMENRTIKETAAAMASVAQSVLILYKFKRKFNASMESWRAANALAGKDAMDRMMTERRVKQAMVAEFVAEIWHPTLEIGRTLLLLQAANEAVYKCEMAGSGIEIMLESVSITQQHLLKLWADFMQPVEMQN